MKRADLHQMALDAWASGTVTLVLLLFMEAAARGFVSRFFNLNWLLLLVLAASIAVMATHPGVSAEAPAHHPPKNAPALLQLGAVLSGVIAWFLLPKELAFHWRAIASGSLLVAALIVWPALSKNE